MRRCSIERGCIGKTDLGSNYKAYADSLAVKHKKVYGVYLCPHCGGHHLTTKLFKRSLYGELLYTTD